MTSEVGKWLNRFNLGLYESYLLANGFDDLEFLVSYEIRNVVNDAHASPCNCAVGSVQRLIRIVLTVVSPIYTVII